MSSEYAPSEQDMDLVYSDDGDMPSPHDQSGSSRIRSPPPRLPPTPPPRRARARAPMTLALPASSLPPYRTTRAQNREELGVPRPDFSNLPAPAARTRNRTELPPAVVDLVGDSSGDEDEVVFVRSSNPNPNRSRAGSAGARRMDGSGNGDAVSRETMERRARVREIAQEMHRIEAALQRHGAETEALLRGDADPTDRQRDIFSPPARPPRPQRIGFGGAVFRSGDRQINFAPLPDGRARERLHVVRAPREQRELSDAAAEAQMGHRNFDWFGAGIGVMTRDILANFGLGPEDNDAGNPPRDAQGWAAVLRNLGVVRGASRAGQGEGEVNVEGEIAKVPLPDYPPTRPGYSADFEITSPPSPIEVDDFGRVVTRKRAKTRPYLACVQCLDPLLISSAYRTLDDRVWALQCGHMLDQKCLQGLSTPETPEQLATVINQDPPAALPILDGGERTRRNKKQKLTKPPKPAEYSWRCPVCSEEHISIQDVDKRIWDQMEGRGALQIYA